MFSRQYWGLASVVVCLAGVALIIRIACVARDSTIGINETCALPRQITNAIDGSVLVCVPAGNFTMGGDGVNGADGMDEPTCQVWLPAYYIGKYAVTNAQFRRFVNATRHNAAGPWEKYERKWGDNAPVVEVSWNDAVAYCRWATLRLPSEAEWEKATRGTDERAYPWGEDWNRNYCHCSRRVDGDAGGAVPVDSFSLGASPYGCLNMMGNVMQWCSSKYRPYPFDPRDGREEAAGNESRTYRGCPWNTVGSMDSPYCFFLACFRQDSKPGSHSAGLGFRVARRAP